MANSSSADVIFGSVYCGRMVSYQYICYVIIPADTQITEYYNQLPPR